MNDVAFVVLALVIGALLRKIRPMKGRNVIAMRLGVVVCIAVIWYGVNVAGAGVSIIAGLLAAGATGLLVQSAKPDKINLRCSGCGNYYPSRDHFATKQLCKTCHAALGSADA